MDEAAGTYRKEADVGVACQSGWVFPLTEGMTGAVVARRGPVWFARYVDVPGGHVAAAAQATLRGVACRPGGPRPAGLRPHRDWPGTVACRD